MAKSALPKELTTVTPLSRLLAIALFLFLPVFAFYVGMQYEKNITSQLTYHTRELQQRSPIQPKGDMLNPTAAPEIPADWKTYMNKKYNFEFKHPPQLTTRETATAKMLTVNIRNASNEMKLEVKPATSTAMMEEEMMNNTMMWESSMSGEMKMHMMEKENVTYTLTVIKAESEELVEKILSTFTTLEEPEKKEEASKSAQ